VASQPIEDSTCELTSKDQSCSAATTSTAATPLAQDFSGQISSTVVASQPIEDSTCELTSKDQSCSTATTSTAATPLAQDFSGQTSKSLLHNTSIKKKQRKVIRAQVQKIRRLRKALQKKIK
ncbi:Hypothetical predicted protein, partial [Paramuricea clavata]